MPEDETVRIQVRSKKKKGRRTDVTDQGLLLRSTVDGFVTPWDSSNIVSHLTEGLKMDEEEAKKIAGNYKNVNILLPDDHGNNINIVTRTLIKAVAKYDRPLALTMFDSMIKQHPVVKAATRKDYRQMVQPYSFDN